MRLSSAFWGIVVFVTIWHFLLGVSLILWEPAAGISSVDLAMRVFQHRYVVGIVYVVVSILAFIGARGGTFREVLFAIPHLFLLGLATTGCAILIYNSHYADGVIRPRTFIGPDQMHIIIIFILYLASGGAYLRSLPKLRGMQENAN